MVNSRIVSLKIVPQIAIGLFFLAVGQNGKSVYQEPEHKDPNRESRPYVLTKIELNTT